MCLFWIRAKLHLFWFYPKLEGRPPNWYILSFNTYTFRDAAPVIKGKNVKHRTNWMVNRVQFAFPAPSYKQSPLNSNLIMPASLA